MSKQGWLFCTGHYFLPNVKRREYYPSLVVESGKYLNPTKIFHKIFHKIPLIFYKEGFIAVCTENEDEASQIIQLLLFRLQNYECQGSSLIQTRNSYIIYYNSKYEVNFEHYQTNPCSGTHHTISINSLKKELKICSKIYQNKELKQDILILTKAIQNYHQKDFESSFIFSWLLIERSIYKNWKEFIIGKISLKERQKYFLNKNAWPTKRIIELLNLLEKINDDKYQHYEKYREIRNKISHGFMSIDSDDAYSCLNSARGILFNKMWNQKLG